MDKKIPQYFDYCSFGRVLFKETWERDLPPVVGFLSKIREIVFPHKMAMKRLDFIVLLTNNTIPNPEVMREEL